MKILNSAVLFFILGARALGAQAEPIALGSRRELLLDDFLIERLSGGAALKLHHPVPREVVLITDKPWEGNTCGYFTIFRDGPLYRMYYRGSHYEKKASRGRRKRRKHRELTCYAESKDGIHWKRPRLGLFAFEGSKENNIVWDGVGTHDFTPFKDPNPNCKPEERYKALGRGEANKKSALFAFTSPDGIHWKPLGEKPVITKGAFDSQNLAFWDPVRGEYREYHRDFRNGKRDIRTCTSKDFRTWTDPVWLRYPGAPSEHLYTNQVRPYYRAPHIYLGFPTRYLPGRGSLTEGLLMSSRDGRTFHRWEEALVRPGLNQEKWGNRCNYIWLGLLETVSDLPGAPPEISLYVNEGYYRGKSQGIRRYTIRVDGFVSLHAPMAGGEALTRVFVFSGKELVLNESTSAAGGIRVEIQDGAGKPVPGFSLKESLVIYGDSLETAVRWKKGASPASLAGKPVRLRFVLRDADIYSFCFRGKVGR